MLEDSLSDLPGSVPQPTSLRAALSSYSVLLLVLPARGPAVGARGCGAVRAGARAPYLAPGWPSLTPAAPGLPVAVYGAAAAAAAADLS